MSKSNWSAFTKKIPIKASMEKVYKAWATQEGLESWFLRKAEFTTMDNQLRPADSPVQKGDRYEWLWHGYNDEVLERRAIVASNGVDELAFTFSGECLVTVRLTQQGEMVICALSQEDIPEDDNPKTNLYVGCGEGWTFYLANLKSILEGGVDLRNKDLSLTRVINS